MPPAPHSTISEAAFLEGLLSDLDDSFWKAVPTPEPSPRKLVEVKTPRKCSAPKITRKNYAPSPSKVFSAGDVDLGSLLEGAEDWDWDDTNSDILSPRKSPVKKVTNNVSLPSHYIPETSTRCIVESIVQPDTVGYSEKNLIVKVDSSQERRRVILRDDWAVTDILIGDIINVLGTWAFDAPSTSSITRSITISSKSNLVILHPDLLLTATSLANALQCRRKSILSNLVRSSSDTTPALVWGHMLHEVMQSCLSEGHWEASWVEQRVHEVILKGLNELVKINITAEQAKREIMMRAKGLLVFGERYISKMPKPGAILSDTRTSHNQGSSMLAVSELLDIEEDIWSPKYGIKGKLDATVHAIVSDPNPPFPQPILSSGPKPLEIKTGRSTAGMEHRAQTILYTVLASERYGVEVPAGLLYYTQSEEVIRVPAGRNEIRGLFVARNELAGYMMRRNFETRSTATTEPEGFLPPTIDDERVCGRCYALDTCMLYRKAVEGVDDTSSPIADVYGLKTSHLSPTRANFFKRWERLISLEEQDNIRFKKELWMMGAAERELKGRCLSSMVLDPTFHSPSTPLGFIATDAKVHSFTYQFIRKTGLGASSSPLNGHIGVGDPITVSVEPNLLALARGFVIQLTPTEIVVGVDHKISLDSVKKQLSNFSSQVGGQIVFRIDKDEFSGGLGKIRDNLAQLFYANGDTRRLELVVDLKRPVFEEDPLDPSPPALNYSAHLNANQAHAMRRVLSAQDYALILGMPGTGKTTVIAAIIKSLVAMGKTILLTSYTHSAVDTILAKLDDAEFTILRLGNIDKAHPDAHKYMLNNRRTPTTIGQMEHQLMTPPVVATTCLSIDHGLFSRRKFDYCIVDEASQITLPTCLGPLRYADKFVLVGDHFQLPPLVRTKAAREGGLDVSLFRRLSDAHPHAVVELAHQYRMNADIMLLSNKLIYQDRLQCGSDVVAQRSLVLPNRAFIDSLHKSTPLCHSAGCWVQDVMSESRKVMFLDTDSLPAHDSRVGDLVENKTEAEIVRQLTDTLVQSGIHGRQIGVITMYRQQVKLLSSLLQRHKEVEILTADRSQGRDKDCIIISMVRSNDSGNVGDLVKDWRRMNVAFTRARSKLIIIGSQKTLQAAALLSEFFKLIDSRGWILRLPPNAHALHSKLLEPSITPSCKRTSEQMRDCTLGQENIKTGAGRPVKKAKVATSIQGILKSRPILKDIVNGEV